MPSPETPRTDSPAAPSTSVADWTAGWPTNEQCAFDFEEHEISYAQLSERILAAAARLVDDGVGFGDRVVFCGLNRVELFENLFACARIGAIFCPLNNRLTTAELAVQLADAKPTTLLSTDGFEGVLGEAVTAAGLAPVEVRVVDAESTSGPSGTAPQAVGSADDPLLMVYTSGTTGEPKGSVMTQAALFYTCRNGIEHQGLTAQDCVLAPLPTFHVGGINIQTLPTLMAGGRVLLERRFDPGVVLDRIARHRPTQTLLVPAMLTAVAGHPNFATTDISCLQGINTGSSLVPEAVMLPYIERGVPVGQVYGTTETGPTAVVLDYDEADEHVGSCGRPAEHTEVRLVDDAGDDVAPGVAGEIWVRGPHLFSHYWNKPEATAAAFVDGWFRTGDVGHLDDAGYLFISDRITDVVISGGENIYPAEVEACLIAHPAIDEVAVLGRPDQRWGETPVAVIVPSEAAGEGETLDIEGLRSWCEGRLAAYKRPRYLMIVDELPRTALGKVRKHVLREQLEFG